MRLINKTLDISLLIMIGLVCLLWYWWLRPYNPLEIVQPLEILNKDKTIQAGNILAYSCIFEKNTKIIPSISRRLVDGVIYSFPSINPKNPVGANNFTCSIQIPKGIPRGTYFLETSACYKMNPIRNICVDYSTEEFEVISDVSQHSLFDI